MVLAVAGCKPSSESSTPSAARPRIDVSSAGSTFIAPLMTAWTAAFAKSGRTQVHYQAIGSGAGVAQFIAKSVDFGVTDAPMTDAQIASAKGPVVHIPLAMGAVVPIYNVPGLAHTVRFTPETLSGIFLGEIKIWNDPKLVATNPLLDMPKLPISVVHRSDGSGTTFALTDYLSKVSSAWKSKVGSGNTVAWPTGLAAAGNEGLASTVQQTSGAIGYSDLAYSLQSNLPIAQLKNQAGSFVEASIDSVAAAAVGEISDDLRYSLTDAKPDTAWPISTTTWAVVRTDMPAGSTRDGVLDFLHWALHDGQKLCAKLNYAPLPAELRGRVETKLNAMERPSP